MFAKERLYLNAERNQLVSEGDKRAAFLYATAGDEIPDSAAEKFGLKDGRLPSAKSEGPPQAPPVSGKSRTPVAGKKPAKATKEQKPADDKELKSGGTKSSEPGPGAHGDGAGNPPSGGEGKGSQ